MDPSPSSPSSPPTSKKREGPNVVPVFPVGPAGKRELRRALVKSTDPAKTISTFQQRHSLHSMASRAFGTTPSYEYRATRNKSSTVPHHGGGEGGAASNKRAVETLDTDSVMTFLSHLGVRQHDVHKRISDTLLRALVDEIRKGGGGGGGGGGGSGRGGGAAGATATAAAAIGGGAGAGDSGQHRKDRLLDLLKSCWMYATTIPELRPVLWAVLKQLGEETPLPVLLALAERDSDSGQLKHPDVFQPLPPLLKRLCWEADWEVRVQGGANNNNNNNSNGDEASGSAGSDPHWGKIKSTLLYEAVEPSMAIYYSNPVLVEAANHPFATTARERRLFTKQRRALTSSAATAATATATAAAGGGGTAAPSAPSGLLLRGARPGALAAGGAASGTDDAGAGLGLASAGRAVAQLRSLLVDTTLGSAAALRPKLLNCVLTICVAQHGASHRDFLGGPAHLHCTLVADILLSAGGPLPKAYHPVLSLAHILDECVQEGNIGDVQLAKVQAALADIFRVDDDVKSAPGAENSLASPTGRSAPAASSKADDASPSKPDAPSNSLVRQLNRIIVAGLASMKEADPQSLFLNPVTDAIAPGYSKMIQKPMSIVTMERKVQRDEYGSVSDWKQDVDLMFKNCVDYNRGPNGQWFRGEAHRQGKVFREEIFPVARRNYQAEVAKRAAAAANDHVPAGGSSLGSKRPNEVQVPSVVPLPASAKKRRKDAKDEHMPSIPALACMLLADPFVVRILIARILRDLRRGVMSGGSIPAAHAAIPSLLQLVHMARWSRPMCAVRGKRYFIPDSGFRIAKNLQEVSSYVAFATLRRCVPLIMRLLLEAEMDRRVSQGGDLFAAAQTLSVELSPIQQESWAEKEHMDVSVSVFQGAIIFLCQPGMGNEVSLALTFPKLAAAIQSLSHGLCVDEPFFLGLTHVIYRHKAKILQVTRDAIVRSWLGWLKSVPESDKGSVATAAHSYLIKLLNEWASLGNKVLPRDTLVQFAVEAVKAAASKSPRRTGCFAELWNAEDDPDFQPVKEQYERMLKLLPVSQQELWKQQVGISDPAS